MSVEQLEKWIKENEFNQIAGERPFVVRSEDLRALFDGKVLVPVDTSDKVGAALRKAFLMGQTYWQQADSEYASHNRKADETMAKYNQLKQETLAILTESQETKQ
jgi:hypothetical protein